MALNSDNKKDIFGLGALIPPSTEIKKEPEIKIVTEEKKVNEAPAKKTPSKAQKLKGIGIKKDDSGLFTARARFFDEDDKNFLRYYGGNLGYNQEEFLTFLIEEDIKDKTGINRKDLDHKEFSTKNLIYYSSIRLPEKIKGDMLKRQAMHSLTQEQYLGYIVRKKRLSTPGWN